jgi:1-acyl-sn-glycerol-3-phosphate acyltransferase
MSTERRGSSEFHNNHKLSLEILTRLVGKGMDIEGEKNIPSLGPAIVVFNHMGTFEALIPMLYLPEPVIFTKIENFSVPVLGRWLISHNAIPVNRGEVDREALNSGITTLLQGKYLVTSPEGTRGRTADNNRTILKPGNNGVVYMAAKVAKLLGKPIPISTWGIWGTEGFLPEIDDSSISFGDRILRQRNRIQVRIAPALYMQPPPEKADFSHSALQPVTDTIMCSLRDILPAEYHGFYRDMHSQAAPDGNLYINAKPPPVITK